MKIGFTGTQTGMSEKQKQIVESKLKLFGANEFHHGDCIGADCEAHNIALDFGATIVIHPPKNAYKRAFCKGASYIESQKEYLERNKDIVDATNLLIATPAESQEKLRSGTWSTIRYAKRMKKHLLIVFPDGNIYEENNQNTEE